MRIAGGAVFPADKGTTMKFCRILIGRIRNSSDRLPHKSAAQLPPKPNAQFLHSKNKPIRASAQVSGRCVTTSFPRSCACRLINHFFDKLLIPTFFRPSPHSFPSTSNPHHTSFVITSQHPIHHSSLSTKLHHY